MDQIEIQTMIWHVSPYWLDMWHITDVTRGMNNLKKKIQKNSKKIQKFFKKFKKMWNWHVVMIKCITTEV